MANYFDMSKVKTFDLADLSGRTLKVEKFLGNDCELTVAFDTKTHETFILSFKAVDAPNVVPQE
ncbi:hypothetical protein tloyanaT_25830 [Thalassotalea loyana]|uniref:Uncharacterized protein n=1 Tax=Thalassotalea loyana TaxID=280483 RepID=A0ABQ6HFR5_9GAMM|nr:hypothetical protein [Thalassotalea loyana]GLX86330.1 hypothetical protein tloyanaT_25830 [Thalassotalea loyana]